MGSSQAKLPPSDEQRAELTVRRAAAFFASLLISPGAGQLALGHRWRGIFWFALGVLTVLPGPLWSIWAFYANLPLRVLSGVDAALLSPPRPRGAGPLEHMPRWLTVIGLWCALMAATFGLKLAAPRFYVGILAADASMAPTIAVDEQVVVRVGIRAKLGDVVALQRPGSGAVTLTRVLALGGQQIALRDGVPTADGKALTREGKAGPCSYRSAARSAAPRKTPQGGAKGDPRANAAPARQDRPCRALSESIAGLRYTVLVPQTPAPEMETRTLGPDELWVWGDNRIENKTPRVVSRRSVLGHARTIWWASKPGGLDWQRIGRKLR